MKFLFLLVLSVASATLFAQENSKTPDKNKELLTVEASCGQCNFGLKGKSCDLAVRVNGKAYFVDGTDIDKHGDAHAEDGFCNAIRKAKVQGAVVNNRFKASYFELLPQEPKKEKDKE